MNILALDAACGAAAACLVGHGKLLSHAEGKEGAPHSQAILPLLEGLLHDAGIGWQNLNMLALGVGPGSFTGVRVGAATLAGINAGLKLPMLPLSSLAITAMQADEEEPLWVIEDARAREAFVGCYRQGSALQQDACIAWQEVGALKPGRFAAHSQPVAAMDGWQRCELRLPRGEAMGRAVLAELEHVDRGGLGHYLQPVYLQISQAERSARGE